MMHRDWHDEPLPPPTVDNTQAERLAQLIRPRGEPKPRRRDKEE